MPDIEQRIRIRPNLRIFKGFPAFIPYLSVFFILLIFFQIGSNFVPVQGVPLELPHAASELIYAPKNLIISIDKDSNIYFNDTPINLKKTSASPRETLKRRISDTRIGRGKSSRKEQLIIRTDVRTPLADLAMLFSIARELDMNAVLMMGGENPTAKTVILDAEKP